MPRRSPAHDPPLGRKHTTSTPDIRRLTLHPKPNSDLRKANGLTVLYVDA